MSDKQTNDNTLNEWAKSAAERKKKEEAERKKRNEAIARQTKKGKK